RAVTGRTLACSVIERLEAALHHLALRLELELGRVLVYPPVMSDLVTLVDDALDEVGPGPRRMSRNEERRGRVVLGEQPEHALEPDRAELAARDHARVVRLERADPDRHPVEVEREADGAGILFHDSLPSARSVEQGSWVSAGACVS